MSDQRQLDTERIIELKRRAAVSFNDLSMEERGELLAIACRDAAAIEASKIAMGMPPSQPAPWPESTRQFLAEAARRVREG
jgi:hypothetical protein